MTATSAASLIKTGATLFTKAMVPFWIVSSSIDLIKWCCIKIRMSRFCTKSHNLLRWIQSTSFSLSAKMQTYLTSYLTHNPNTSTSYNQFLRTGPRLPSFHTQATSTQRGPMTVFASTISMKLITCSWHSIYRKRPLFTMLWWIRARTPDSPWSRTTTTTLTCDGQIITIAIISVAWTSTRRQTIFRAAFSLAERICSGATLIDLETNTLKTSRSPRWATYLTKTTISLGLSAIVTHPRYGSSNRLHQVVAKASKSSRPMSNLQEKKAQWPVNISRTRTW